MCYLELIHTLYTLNRSSRVKLGLGNPLRLDFLLGSPSKAFPSIHVAGTNGKGSVCWKIASALELAGYRVGLYTSPHISSFCERIRINRRPISEQEVEEILPPLIEIAEQAAIPATFFELTTLLAFHYFAQKCVDVAVIEVGLGGRLDATNIITPILSAITSISFDHCDTLGSTLESIAKEKGGIIKESIPVVAGPRVPREVVRAIAKEKNSRFIGLTGMFTTYDDENRAIARSCLQELRGAFDLTATHIEHALEVRPPCRMESRVCEEVKVIFDVAHNPDGLQALFQWVAHRHPDIPLEVVLGLSSNKEIALCLAIVQKYAQHIHLVAANCERAADPKVLAAGLREESRSIYDAVSLGIKGAMARAKRGGHLLIICGTFFIMSEALSALGIREERDSVNLNVLMRRCSG